MIKVKDSSYKAKIKESTGYVVLFFSSSQCPHCKPVRDFLRKNVSDLDRVSVFEVDSERSPKLLRKLNVRAFPSVLLFDENGDMDSYVFGANMGELQKMFGPFYRHRESGSSMMKFVKNILNIDKKDKKE